MVFYNLFREEKREDIIRNNPAFADKPKERKRKKRMKESN